MTEDWPVIEGYEWREVNPEWYNLCPVESRGFHVKLASVSIHRRGASVFMNDEFWTAEQRQQDFETPLEAAAVAVKEGQEYLDDLKPELVDEDGN